jgi:hypothetical protein
MSIEALEEGRSAMGCFGSKNLFIAVLSSFGPSKDHSRTIHIKRLTESRKGTYNHSLDHRNVSERFE